MTKPIPQIQKYMTTTPVTVEKDASLTEAARIMKEHNIRHLPVLNRGKIAGILSNTDVTMIRTLKDVSFEALTVSDCYTPNAFTVKPSSLLNDVLSEMAEKKFGSVLVEDNGNLVGIFTWVDALKATTSLLETRLR